MKTIKNALRRWRVAREFKQLSKRMAREREMAEVIIRFQRRGGRDVTALRGSWAKEVIN